MYAPKFPEVKRGLDCILEKRNFDIAVSISAKRFIISLAVSLLETLDDSTGKREAALVVVVEIDGDVCIACNFVFTTPIVLAKSSTFMSLCASLDREMP